MTYNRFMMLLMAFCVGFNINSILLLFVNVEFSETKLFILCVATIICTISLIDSEWQERVSRL